MKDDQKTFYDLIAKHGRFGAILGGHMNDLVENASEKYFISDEEFDEEPFYKLPVDTLSGFEGDLQFCNGCRFGTDFGCGFLIQKVCEGRITDKHLDNLPGIGGGYNAKHIISSNFVYIAKIHIDRPSIFLKIVHVVNPEYFVRRRSD